MPREELRELQLERMRESLRNAYENVPLYRERFDAAGVTPDDLESLEDIAKFPFVVKQDMRDNYPFGMFARENADVARIHASSGTTGQATVVGHTANDLANWGDCFARGIAMVGGDENSTIQVSYGYGLFTGGLGAHAGGEAMGCTVIPTSSGNTKRQVQMLRDCKTDILACTPSYALLIADTAIEMGYDPATEFQISGGIFGAEPCSENMRQEIADKLGIQYCDVYGLSEIMGPGVAMECAERGGLHIAEDQFYCEIIDPETLEVLPDGEVGELVITTLTRECSPMIRYRTRDVTTINAEPCACGRTHRKIGRLLGRTDDMLIIRGVNVFPSQIEQVITEFPEIATQYQIILTMNGPLDHVELQVETEPDFPIDEVRRLEDQFYCEIIDPETLEVLPDGEVGELVITTLTRECSPMIRYRTRDVTTINAEPCACGRTHRKIGRLLGRTDDMLIIRGVNVFPSQIEQVITEFPEIATQYQIILTMNGPLDHVELQVETEPDFPIDEVRRLEDLRNRLAAALKSNLQVAVDIKFVEPKTIARSEGKAKRVIDLRGENQ